MKTPALFFLFLLLIRGSIGDVMSSPDTLSGFFQCLLDKMPGLEYFSKEEVETMEGIIEIMKMSLTPSQLTDKFVKNHFIRPVVMTVIGSDPAHFPDRKREYVSSMAQCSLFATGAIDTGFISKVLAEMSIIEINKYGNTGIPISQAPLASDSQLQHPVQISEAAIQRFPVQQVEAPERAGEATPNLSENSAALYLSKSDVGGSSVVRGAEPSSRETLPLGSREGVVSSDESTLLPSEANILFPALQQQMIPLLEVKAQASPVQPSELSEETFQSTYPFAKDAAAASVIFSNDGANSVTSSDLSSLNDPLTYYAGHRNTGLETSLKKTVLFPIESQMDSTIQAPLKYASSGIDPVQFEKILAELLSNSRDMAALYCCDKPIADVSHLSFSVLNLALNNFDKKIAFTIASSIVDILSHLPSDSLCSKYSSIISKLITNTLRETGLLDNADAAVIVDRMSENFRSMVVYDFPRQSKNTSQLDVPTLEKKETLSTSTGSISNNGYDHNTYIESLAGEAQYYRESIQDLLKIIENARLQMRSRDSNLIEVCHTLNGISPIINIPRFGACRKTTVMDYLMRVLEVTLGAFDGTISHF